MIVRSATASDLAAIARIQETSPEASQWDPASYLDYCCTVAEESGNILGFLVFRQVAPAEYEILNLAVDPSARRRGVARRLLQAELAQRPGEWFLEVRESNGGAIQLYEAMGFKPAGRRESYYRNPPEPGIVMKFDS
jgi:ribosomal-protein-alanine N-acetyltransferase